MSIFLSAVFILICILLMIIILLQKGRGGGLSGAFGGAGGHSAFGTKTGDVMTWTTVVLAFLFLSAAVALNLWFRPGDQGDLGARAPRPVPVAPAGGQAGLSGGQQPSPAGEQPAAGPASRPAAK